MIAPHYAVPMVMKTMRVFEAFSASGPHLSLTEVMHLCNLPKASTYRILETLRDCGYLSRNRHGLYRLTFRLLDVAGVAQRHNRLRQVALPFLERLRRTTGETVNLGMIEGDEVIYADVLESSHSLRMVPRVGATAPMHATALGKSIAARLPRSEPPRTGRRRFTERTITAEQAFEEELQRVRERGYAIDEQEEAGDCTCVGAAIVDGGGRILGAVSVSAPTSRLAPSRIARVGREVRDCARTISEQFGFIPETAGTAKR